jgi:zinc-binding dehydrogenase
MVGVAFAAVSLNQRDLLVVRGNYVSDPTRCRPRAATAPGQSPPMWPTWYPATGSSPTWFPAAGWPAAPADAAWRVLAVPPRVSYVRNACCLQARWRRSLTRCRSLKIAKSLGTRGAVSSPSAEKLARVASSGADLAVNYRRPGWVEQVREWSGGGVDAMLDIGGAASLQNRCAQRATAGSSLPRSSAS